MNLFPQNEAAVLVSRACIFVVMNISTSTQDSNVAGSKIHIMYRGFCCWWEPLPHVIEWVENSAIRTVPDGARPKVDDDILCEHSFIHKDIGNPITAKIA